MSEYTTTWAKSKKRSKSKKRGEGSNYVGIY